MAGTKYLNRIITETGEKAPPPIPGVKSTHVLKVDKTRIKDFFSVDCTWYWSARDNSTIREAGVSKLNQVIGFVGLNPEDPHDLTGELTVWIDGEKQVINRSCLIFVPARMKFGPVQINTLKGQFFYASVAPNDNYKVDLSPEDWKYSIIYTTKAKSDDPPPISTMKSSRILHIEDDMARGAFYVDYVWLYKGYGVLGAPEHTHDYEELIAMIGSDPEHPREIGGILSMDLEGEPYYVTQSSLICIPRQVKHCPWKFLDVRRPTLVFTAIPSGRYVSSYKDKW
ncbi:MAG TPA: hypothetical protein VMB24_06685 [Dehalococcoidales bacterium]|nr:hypothetical protein [Dehalococcoidales bacterium]